MHRILLVDDEANVRWTFTQFLSRAGYEVEAAGDFDGGVAALDRAEIDVAIIDILLGSKSGIDLLREVRSRKPYIPVIMITADPDLTKLPEIMRQGAYDFMAKPVVKVALLSAVSRAIEKKRLIDEKCRLEEEVRQHAEQLERLVAERTRELALAHNFLNTVLESSTEYAIVAADLAGCIKLFNRGAELMFGCSAEHVLGGPVADLVADSGGSQGRTLLGLPHVHQMETRRQMEILLRRANGTTFTGGVTLTPIRKHDGPALGYLGIIKDLTVEHEREEALRQMQARLNHTEKISALGRAAAQVAHEVKNPLAGLSLYALHLKKKIKGRLEAGEMELMDKIILGIDHLADTVERVLDYARPLKLVCSYADVNGLVTEAAQMLELQMAQNDVETRLELCPSRPHAFLDEAAIRSALINLMLNAVQAMPGGGTLTLATDAEGDRFRIRISDTGCGMTQEQIKNVFEPFYSTKSKGLGLGMPFAKKIVEEHRGLIHVESRPGMGTRTELVMPFEELKTNAVNS